MKLTDRARRDLESYLREVRHSLSGDPDVDPEEVVAGIREHVEAALSRGASESGTAEDLADVLERLGSPEQWADPGAGTAGPESSGGAPAGPPSTTLLRPALAPVLLVGVGGVLVLAEVAVALGWGLIVTGAVAARMILESSGARAGEEALAVRLVTLLWHVSAAAGAAVLALLPAVLIWGQSQTGGVFEPIVLDHTLPPVAPPASGSRPGGYWPLVALLAGTTTGVWWTALGLLARSGAGKIRRALGPAEWIASRPMLRALLVAGALLLVGSLLLLIGAVA